jgi:PEP-CTERM motif
MKRLSLLAAVLTLFLSVVGQAEAGTILVDPSNLNGWVPTLTDSNGVPTSNPSSLGNSGSVGFVTGPATPPLGTGSLNLLAGNDSSGNSGSAQVYNNNYSGVLLSSLTSLSYSTYVTSNNGQQFPYLKLNVDLTGTGDYDQLFFEPPYQTPSTGNPALPDQGATALNTWQNWNALTGGWWDNNDVLGPSGMPGTGVASLAAFLAQYPNAIIENVPNLFGAGANANAVTLQFGYADPGSSYNGYVDNFTIGVNGASTTYNFDPNPAPEPASLTLLAIGAIGMVGFGWRKRKRAAV